eukprot:TRINITY_DN10013_c0_g1_i1.p1 TRINITY_DN10013_c0_g1~~TRINITY_DN10013_c0_g1_i1.p1  ORF type:complete len:380 (+),score=132.02 TRINITY_DN10013_c0_g1_i1:59-1198(+)
MALLTIALLMLLPASIVGQPVAFVMDVLNSNFSGCYMQLFEQSVNNIEIKNHTDTAQISFSTSLTSLAISSCASTSINIQSNSGATTFSTALTFADGDDATCLNSIESNDLGLSTSPAGNAGCYCSSGIAYFLTGYSSQSEIVCNVSVSTTWNSASNINNNFWITYSASPNPVAYPAFVIIDAASSKPANEEKPAPVEIVKSAEKSKDAVAPAGGDPYNVDMYVLQPSFAKCVPSLFSQNVNDLKATNLSTYVYVTFTTALTTIDVSQCAFSQIGIQSSANQNTLATSLSFADQSDCSSSVASNAVSVSSGGYCDGSVCYCAYNCATTVFTGVTTTSSSVCSISLDISWSSSAASANTGHTYLMLPSPTAYPTSFTVDV